MKKSVCFFKLWGFTLAIIAACCLSGCQDDFDDSEIRRQMEDLANRVGSLETLCNQMNTNITSVQTIVNALQQQDYITGVNPVMEGSVTIGYTITFAKNKAITVYHGKNGEDGKDGSDGVTPLIGVEKDADGLYYWKLNGEWLKDGNGDKIKASGKDGKDRITPRLKIEDGFWWISVDNGQTWHQEGQVTDDTFFKVIDNSAEDCVKFIFTDGTVIEVPKKSTFSISFAEPMPLKIAAGETIEIAYSLSQGDDKTLVKTLVQNGWKAVVNKKDNLSGSITITAPEPITDDEVLVFTSDGKEKTVMSAISFCIVILENIQDNTVKVSSGNGDLNLEITSNIEVKVVPKNKWIVWDEQPASKSLITNNFHFAIQANQGEQSRTGYIEVQDMGGKSLKTITIIQGNALEEELAKEREILIKFYHSTNGDQWKNNTNWCSDKPLLEWYGVSENNGHVENLLLGYNKLSGNIPIEIGNLTNLEILDLSQNQLSGTIPSSIGKLEKLINIYLSENHLTGTIPMEIWNLTNIETLNLASNQLSGIIPSSIGKLEKLISIFLSNNQLTGTIPMEIGDLTNLEILDLSKNQLSGTIPLSIGKLEKLINIYLSENHLTGRIPMEIGNLSNLTSLFLSDNQLSGKIPSSLGQLKELKEIYLMRNQLSGTIPIEIGNLSNLTFLILSDNRLSGEIPSSLGQLIELETLHLGRNQLTGEIPTSLSNLTNLKSFQLGDNQLTGNIPPEICHYKYLDNFYIGDNNLIGNLPEEFVNIMYANPGVCNNCLTGEIPVAITEQPNWSSRAPFILPQKQGYGLTFKAYASTDYSEDGKIVKLQQATEGKGVNIVILGDGFTDKDFASGKYDEVMRQATENLFSVEPMKSFRHLFNVYTVKAVSKNNLFIEGYETAFGGWFDGVVSAGGNHEKCQEYASKIDGINLSETVILVVMNSLVHAGSNYWIEDGPGISYLPTEKGHDSQEFEQVIHHEVIGHAFARFADEYWYDNEAAMPDSEREVLKDSHSKGWWLNVDMTNDLTEILWNKFIVDERYANEQLGVYEGAFLCAKNIYRATETSIMQYNTGGFNAQQREVIYKLIMRRAYGDSWQYDYEKFVEYDAINRSAVPRLLRRAAVVPKDFKPLAPPVIIWK